MTFGTMIFGQFLSGDEKLGLFSRKVGQKMNFPDFFCNKGLSKLYETTKYNFCPKIYGSYGFTTKISAKTIFALKKFLRKKNLR